MRRRALTLILTPRWITGAEDLHAIFRERLRQRQEYIDRLYLQSTAVADRPPPDYARTRGLVEEIHQSMTAARSP